MAEIYFDVDTALSEVPINIFPLTDDTDFKTRETAIAYNQAGMDLVWNFVTTAGAYTQTAVTPTTGGDYDWTHQGDGMYSIEIPASGGASINNDTEGFGWFTGICTGVLAWRSPIFGFRAAALNNALIDGGDLLDVNVTHIADTSQTGRDIGSSVLLSSGTGTGQLDFTSGVVKANLVSILGTLLTETAGYLSAGFKKFFNVASPVFTAESINQTGDAFNRIGVAGAGLTALGDTRIAYLDASITSRLTATGCVVPASIPYIGDFTEDYQYIEAKFNTNKSDGTLITLSGTPAISVYKRGTTTESTAGVSLTVDYDSRTGLNQVIVDSSADVFYEKGYDYDIVLTSGTVNGLTVVGVVLASFSIENRYHGLDSMAV
jgi:hypothetical protein